MRLRVRLLGLSISTVAVIVTVLFILHIDSLGQNWLAQALERNNVAGKNIISEIAGHISDRTVDAPAMSPEETKKNWNRILAADTDLADLLVQQAAVRSGVIVEINILNEDGKVVVSSIPSRQGQNAPVRESLQALESSDFVNRVKAIGFSRTDYETRVPMGIPDQDKPVFEVQLLVSPILLRDKILPDLRSTAVASLFALLAAVVLAGVSANLALRPVKRIGKAIDTITTGRPLGLSYPARDRDDREIAAVEYKLGLLGQQMQGARRDADQMRSAIGTLARGVAHEIKNPLNAIALRLETLRMKIADEVPEAEGEIDMVSNEVHRLDKVVRTFLDLNRPLELDITTFDPAELAAGVIEIMRPAASQAKVELEITGPAKPFTVQGDRGLIEQGLLNIVNNAIQALGGSAAGLVRTVVSLVQNNCEIAVSDNGPGMSESVRDRIFEPYFTTKDSGSGIGLAVTKRAMDLHHGNIRVDSAPGTGTTMILSFPVRRA